MRRVKPTAFLVGETAVHFVALGEFLDQVGVSNEAQLKILHPHFPPVSDAEVLIEAFGRMCYRSYEPGLNANVTKVREGNDTYIANILKTKHGSVLEHGYTNWIFHNVSRVFTHELVRHRAGTAFSQESMRYVRLTDLGLWLPPEIEQDPKLIELFEKAFKDAEELQLDLAEYLKLDQIKDFGIKKKLTSAMRRIAPDGLSTTIGFSCNFRALRHLLALRTEEAAEVEIREVFDQVGEICKTRWPNIFQDFQRDDKGQWIPENPKV